MEIERINNYTDSRFSSEVLKQHGAFIVDGKYPCSFRIISGNAAEVDYHDYDNVKAVIDEFRFFARHIDTFYDSGKKLISSFEPVKIREMSLDEIQPSQFCADEDKVKAVESFIRSGWDIVVPVMYSEKIGRYISLDGHTRMYYAYLKGFKSIRIFEEEADDNIFYFANEAMKRGIYKISDLTMLPHDEYEVKWNKFCEEFFSDK